MNEPRFTLTRDNRVLCHGYELGRVHEHPNLTQTFPRKPSKWFAVDADGICAIVNQRDLAALAVIRRCYPEASLASIDYEEAA